MVGGNARKKEEEVGLDTMGSQQDGEKDRGDEVRSLDDLQELAGSTGRWNVTVIVLACFCTFTTPLNALAYQFLGATPNYWCHVVPLVEANWTDEEIINFAIPSSSDRNMTENWSSCQIYDYNYTLAVQLGYQESVNNNRLFPKVGAPVTSCTSRDFNRTHYQSTIVTEWDLVCSRRALYSTTQAMVSIGDFIGSLVFGCLIEEIGRRRSMLLASAMAFVTGMVAAFSPTLYFYMVMRILISTFTIATDIVCVILCLEICSPKYRSHVGSLYSIPWALGYMMLPGLAYLVRDWQMLQIALTIPNVFSIIYIWTLPESPRWLVVHGKKEEALKVLTKAASVNGKTLPPEKDMLAAMDRINQKNTRKECEKEVGLWRQMVGKVQWFTAPLILPNLRKVALPVLFCWITTSMIYFGVSFSAINLSMNLYVYIFLGGLLEIPALLILWPMSIHLGRRKSMMFLFLVCAFTFLLIMLQQICIPDGSMIFLGSLPGFLLAGWSLLVSALPGALSSILVGFALNPPMLLVGRSASWSWVPLMCVLVIAFGQSVGAGPIPWILTPEYFPTVIRSQPTSVCLLLGGLQNVAALQLYSPMQASLIQAGLYWTYGLVAAVGIPYSLLFVKETAGRRVG